MSKKDSNKYANLLGFFSEILGKAYEVPQAPKQEEPLNGLYVEFHPDASVVKKVLPPEKREFYKDGTLKSVSTFYENGEITRIGSIIQQLDMNGQIVTVSLFENGTEISHKVRDPKTGEMVETIKPPEMN